jgi:hypothetical protein
MANPNLEPLAAIYQILKRHEQVLTDLTVDVEALKSILTGQQRVLLQQAQAKARSARSAESEAQARLYDGMIRLAGGK